MYRILRWLAIFIVIIMALAVGFTAGIVADRQSLLPVTGLFSKPDGGQTSGPNGQGLNVSLIQQAYRVIQQNYADQSALKNIDLTYGAMTGMVDSLGDTGHSRFLTPQMLQEENRQIQGEYEGIGALLNVNEQGNPIILAPMDGSPAQKAGLKPGDIILEVNGEDVSHATPTQVAQRVLGPAGTPVTLTVRSPDSEESRTVTITRAKITVRNVTWQMLPGTKIAHVRIASFSQHVSDDLIKALKEAQDQGAQGVILDLRNNPGGLLDEAINVTSQFIDTGNVLQTKDAKGNVQNISVKKGGGALNIPMVVLINKGSASAAEITAGALQDYGRAQLIGETTFGTGTVLNQFHLPDGSALLLATELWLTPKGRVIWHHGIAPDIEAKLPASVTPSVPESERDLTAQQLQSSPDVQLLKALETIQGKIK